MNLSDLMSNIAAKNEGKLGYTTTVKQQVDSIENNIDNFKKVLESQRKQQRQIQYELKKMQEQSKTSFHDLQQEISERVNYLTQQLKSDNNAQGKQFEYLQLQNKNLYDQHDKLNELATNVSGRTQQAQTNVGM